LEKITKQEIVDFFNNNVIELNCTQTKISVPVVDRLYRKMKAEIKFFEIGVDETWICDGHHRYVAALLAGYKLDRRPYPRTPTTEVIDWESIHLDESDWDTPEKIAILNEEDAKYNNVSIEFIKGLLE
jgi:hypothetical protein